MEDYHRRLAGALSELKAAGVRSTTANPPVHRLLRVIGIPAKPPHYQDGRSLFLYFSVWFAVIWGLFMWLALWRTQEIQLEVMVFLSAAAGAVFGGLMMLYYRTAHKRLHLTEWEAL